LNARLKLVITGILLCLALGLTVFCAVQTVQAFQRFQQEHKLAVTGDVSTIRPWMTVPFIAHFYHVPESYLDQLLHITNDRAVHHLPLRELAAHVNRPVDGLIHDIQHAILNYRKHRTGVRTRAGTSPAPTLYALRGPHRYRVGAGLAPALAHTFARAMVHSPVPALVNIPAERMRA